MVRNEASDAMRGCRVSVTDYRAQNGYLNWGERPFRARRRSDDIDSAATARHDARSGDA
jgi:hypothetical protein